MGGASTREHTLCTFSTYTWEGTHSHCQSLEANRPRRLLGIHNRSWPDRFARRCRSAYCKARMRCPHPRQVGCGRTAARRPSCVGPRQIGQKRGAFRSVSPKRFASLSRKKFRRVMECFYTVRVVLHQTQLHLRTCLWVLLQGEGCWVEVRSAQG